MALPGVLAGVLSPLQCRSDTLQRAWSSHSFHPQFPPGTVPSPQGLQKEIMSKH